MSSELDEESDKVEALNKPASQKFPPQLHPAPEQAVAVEVQPDKATVIIPLQSKR